MRTTFGLFVFVLLSAAVSSSGQDAGLVANVREQAAPRQPIEFSHKLHAGEKKIACNQCHPIADPGEMAGIPDTAMCMQCHDKLPARSGSTRKLAAFARQNKDIDWVRVYQIPTFVSFNHRAHVEAGASCSTCHGAVAEREQLFQEKDMSMGSCVECHRAKQASIDCNYCHAR